MQGGHRLALAPGGDYHRLLLRKTLDLVYVNQNALRHVHISELGADPEDVLHAAPGNSDLAPVLFGAVYHLLQPVHVRGEGGDYDALGAVLELVFKIRGYDALGEGVARVLDVGGVGDEGENAALAELAEAGKVDHAAVDRRGVDLIVACVDDGADRSADGKGDRVGYGVVDVDELDLEIRADLYGFARLDHVYFDLFRVAALGQLDIDEGGGQRSAVNGNGGELVHHEGHSSDVILVTVGEDDGLEPVPVLRKIGYIGNNGVDAVHIVVGKADPAVDDYHLVTVLVDVHIFADLVKSAESGEF